MLVYSPMSCNPTAPDYDLADRIALTRPAQVKAISHPLRTTILGLLHERAATVTELAVAVERPKSTVAHHVKVLTDAGLVQVVRTRRVRAVDERFYGRTARTIKFHQQTPGELPFFNDVLAEVDFERVEAKEPGAYATLRHARIPSSRAEEFATRLDDLALEFIALPRDGDLEFGLFITMYPTTRLKAP